MSPFVALLAVIAVLYFMDSWLVVPKGAILFRSELGQRYRAITAVSSGIRVLGDLFLLRKPWSPLGRVFVAELPALQLDAEALSPRPLHTLPPIPPPESVDAIPLAELGRVERDGAKLTLTTGSVIKLATEAAAQRLARILNRLAQASPRARQRWQRHAQQRFYNVQETEQRLRLFRLQSLELRVLSSLLTLVVLGYLGLLSANLVPLRLDWVAFVYVTLIAGIAICYRSLHIRHLPMLHGQRRTHLLLMLISPAEAMTAPHILSRELLSDVHPLVAAKVLLEPDDFADLAGQVLRAAHNDAPSTHFQQLEQFVRAQGLDPETLFAAPYKPSTAQVYCPRCQAQFAQQVATCSDCHTVATVAF